MTIQRYNVRKINLFPLAKFGCALGGLAMLLPGVICAVIGMQVVGILRSFFDQWQSTELELLGGLGMEFDFIQIMGLEATQSLLVQLDNQGLTLAALIVLGSVLGGGLLIAIIIMLVGWGYNLLAAMTGGLEVELKA